jgi:hypothetical protein
MARHVVDGAEGRAGDTPGTPDRVLDAAGGQFGTADGMVADGGQFPGRRHDRVWCGVLVSSLLPRSQPEQQVAGRVKQEASEHSGQVTQAATGTAQHVRDDLREPTRQAAESVKSTAGEAAPRCGTRAAGPAVTSRNDTTRPAERILRIGNGAEPSLSGDSREAMAATASRATDASGRAAAA